jgi:hypothetical protein
MRAGALLAGLAAAWLLPGRPLGIGVPIVAFLVAATAARVSRPSPGLVGFGALALVLATLAAIRDAGWVVALDLTGAWLAACAAVAGPRAAALAAPLRRLPAARVLVPRPSAEAAPVARGALIGLVVTVPFGILFWSADAAFAGLWELAPVPSVESAAGRVIAFALVAAAAVGLALARPEAPRDPRPPARRLTRWEWVLPLVLLDALFAIFVAVQLVVLFGGHDHVLRTAGLTYAEYARDGFWQLVAAAALTLAVIGAAARIADVHRRADRLLLRTLLGLLSLLTLVVLASALHRLDLYVDAFGLTRLRIAVAAFCAWLGGALGLVLLAGLAEAVRRRLAPVAAALTGIGLVAFSLANPDGIVAERNVERWRETGRIDLHYLGELSADAVPALAALPAPLREPALAPIVRELGAEPWSSLNLARARARRYL